MAKSSGYFGLRRGSTKSHTFSVLNGQQITKDRVEGGKNPRTLNQMVQRCLVATIGQAYGALKVICDHSFEGISAGNLSMNEFMSANLKAIRLSKEYGNQFFGFAKYQEQLLVPGSYILSKGSLDDCAPDMSIRSVLSTNKTITIDAALGQNISEIAESLGMRNFGDMATFCMLFPLKNGGYAFGAVRLAYKQGADVAGSFDVAFAGSLKAASIEFANNTLAVIATADKEMKVGALTDDVAIAAIASRYANGKWLRSNARFDMDNCEPTFDEAIATYPIGQERFLNGEGNEGGDTPSPATQHAVTLGQTADSTGGEDVTLSGDGNYDAGDSVTVEAEYDGPSGTTFDGWYDAASGGTKKSSNESYTFTMPDADVALYAKYV